MCHNSDYTSKGIVGQVIFGGGPTRSELKTVLDFLIEVGYKKPTLEKGEIVTDRLTTLVDIGDITIASPMAPTYLNFGNIKIHCKTGEVTGLSENISEDAKLFWEHIKENILG
jgi:hypothetical protein